MYKEVNGFGHPNSCSNGFIKEHRLVAEEKIGRLLKRTECVHHIDENKLNNSIENIIVFKTIADHSRFHKTGFKVKSGDVYISPKQPHLCNICGKEIWLSSKNKLCISCYLKTEKQKTYKIKKKFKPEEFLHLYKENPSIRSISKYYGISDNGLRKWLGKYNIPTNRKKLKEMI